ncbi:Uu.00g143560.m01.CDS01 [Anthostomella pinea]|uniref:Uu.00g143560.m01.CDS01 n=1 Tax=Anthostomella pinea TaxID=933095 RepID=A0AAI8VQR1_9PEZI|nr:Uu.00g143560.m01.CDS01 [Anthostomella pinea]
MNVTSIPLALALSMRPVKGLHWNLQTYHVSLMIATLIAVCLTTRRLWTGPAADEPTKRIPPGPQGLPIIGSFAFLTHFPERTLDRWAKKYGDLYSVWLGNQLFLIISSPSVARDIMVTNGAVTSSRKEMFIKSQTVFAGRGITATPYDDRWRKHRRIAAQWLSQKAVDSYTSVLDFEATDVVRSLLDASNGGRRLVNPQPHAGRCSLNNMLSIMFARRTDCIGHPLVAEALRLSCEFISSREALNAVMIKDIERRMQRGENVADCLSRTMLSVRGEEGLDDLDMTMGASAFMIGGVETTASMIQWFSALIPSHPDVQKRAQEELDRVIGRDRLPTVEDEIHLPYCHAIVKEIERCHNPFWLGTPHVASEGFTYRGYDIPKDTVLVLNTWTMHHNQERYSDPMNFNPDRYLKDQLSSAQSSNLADPNQRDHWMFGAGRRICPGMIVAEREIWLAISRMLWAFDLEAAEGHPIDLMMFGTIHTNHAEHTMVPVLKLIDIDQARPVEAGAHNVEDAKKYDDELKLDQYNFFPGGDTTPRNGGMDLNILSIGVVMARLIVRKHFMSIPKVRENIQKADQIPADTDADLLTLMKRCLAVDPVNRPRLQNLLFLLLNNVAAKNAGTYKGKPNETRESGIGIQMFVQQNILDANIIV